MGLVLNCGYICVNSCYHSGYICERMLSLCELVLSLGYMVLCELLLQVHGCVIGEWWVGEKFFTSCKISCGDGGMVISQIVKYGQVWSLSLISCIFLHSTFSLQLLI